MQPKQGLPCFVVAMRRSEWWSRSHAKPREVIVMDVVTDCRAPAHIVAIETIVAIDAIMLAGRHTKRQGESRCLGPLRHKNGVRLH